MKKQWTKCFLKRIFNELSALKKPRNVERSHFRGCNDSVYPDDELFEHDTVKYIDAVVAANVSTLCL